MVQVRPGSTKIALLFAVALGSACVAPVDGERPRPAEPDRGPARPVFAAGATTGASPPVTGDQASATADGTRAATGTGTVPGVVGTGLPGMGQSGTGDIPAAAAGGMPGVGNGTGNLPATPVDGFAGPGNPNVGASRGVPGGAGSSIITIQL